MKVMISIRISKHAAMRAIQRGATEQEITACIADSQYENVEKGRISAKKDFEFNDISPMNNNFYQYKTVEVIFVEERESITVITVKVFYSNREANL